jgi:hypothetical protein
VYALEGGKEGQKAEIKQRILYQIMRKQEGFPPGLTLRINPGRSPEWNPDHLSYGEFSELLRSVRKLLAVVRAIDADDLNLPEQTAAFSVVIEELEERAAGAERALTDTLKDFESALATPDSSNPESLRGLILRTGSFGVAGAVPLSVKGDAPTDREMLIVQAGSICRELGQRKVQLDRLADQFAGHGEQPGEGRQVDPPAPEDRRRHALARLQTIFGKAFVVLPHFAAENGAELEQALKNSTQIQDGDPMVAVTWFQRMARVRDGVSRLDQALGYAEALGRSEKLNLAIAQLPFEAEDRWVGLPLKSGQSLPGGKLSLAVQAAAPVDMHEPLAGMLIDEWVEVVPNTVETTGISFQYDQPNAAPPQTILIAVPPEIGAPWTARLLQQVLLETLDLARIRAVDPDALDDVGHYLPALYFAYNTTNMGAISTDFSGIR